MLPVIIPIDSGGIYVLHIFVLLSWFVFSFLFWRGLRRWGIDEDRIFDLVFYATLVAILSSRAGFVIGHYEQFVGKSWLLMVALWVAPGLSWIAGIVGGVATMVGLSRQYKVRLGLVLDTLSVALPLPIILGLAGALLTGADRGKLATLISFGGSAPLSFRHPVSLYEMLGLVVISIFLVRLSNIAVKRKWAYGIVGMWFFLLYSGLIFILEFFREAPVYWGQISATQWVVIAIFAECLGVMYVRGGGRERMRPLFSKLRNTAERLTGRLQRKKS
jgi:prolipoprotein diacylglyceryltransferase